MISCSACLLQQQIHQKKFSLVEKVSNLIILQQGLTKKQVQTSWWRPEGAHKQCGKSSKYCSTSWICFISSIMTVIFVTRHIMLSMPVASTNPSKMGSLLLYLGSLRPVYVYTSIRSCIPSRMVQTGSWKGREASAANRVAIRDY